MAEKSSLTVVAICGSLRKGSYNAALLRTAIGLKPASMTIETFNRIGEFPLYNADVQAQGIPQAVQDLGARIRAADGVLFVTPEYNYSVPGVLKNAIDWASRLQPQPFLGKPICIMGAAAGALGTGRAQYDLRRMMVFLDAVVMNKPEVFVGVAHTKFNDEGVFTDEAGKGFVKQALESFVHWIKKHG